MAVFEMNGNGGGGSEIPEYTEFETVTTSTGSSVNISFTHDIGYLNFEPTSNQATRPIIMAYLDGNTLKILGKDNINGASLGLTLVDSKNVTMTNPNSGQIYKVWNFYA